MENSTTLIKSLILQNFRNYKFRKFEFSPCLNFIIGKNGTGKTNLLEAISLLAISSGIKGAEMKDLNENFTNPFLLGYETTYGQIGIYNQNGVKKIKLEEEALKFAELEKKFSLLSLTPEEEFVFTESTSKRRKFFDKLLSIFSPLQEESLKLYKNLCMERTKILSEYGFESQNTWLNTLEKQIAQNLVIISTNRVLLSEELSRIMQKHQSFGLLGEIVLTGYLENKILNNTFIATQEEQHLKELLGKSRKMDSVTGKTLTSLERTNFDVMFAQKNILASKTSSGEQKKMLFSLFLATAKKLLETKSNIIMLIDEVISKLDTTGREFIINELLSLNAQIFLTSTEVGMEKIPAQVHLIEI